jgi:hypothetical protein
MYITNELKQKLIECQRIKTGMYFGFDEVEEMLDAIGEITRKTCKHRQTNHKKEFNTHPYGESYEWDECLYCGKKLHIKSI